MTQSQIYIYGIDLGKNWFHLVAMDRMGHVLTKQKLTRSQLKQFISTTPPCRRISRLFANKPDSTRQRV